MTTTTEWLSHWHQSLAEFQTSVQDFYGRVSDLVTKGDVPGAQLSRVRFAEAGAFSDRREYLRIERCGFRFDVCAAPFGSGFFVSWWLTKAPVPWWLITIWLAMSVVSWSVLYFLCTIALGLGTSLLGFALQPAAQPGPFGGPASMMGFNPLIMIGQLFSMVVAYGASVVLFFVGLHVLARRSLIDEEVVLAIPILGWIYGHIFSPTTFYRLDTAQVFRDVVHSAVQEALEGATAGKGVRILADLKDKPIMTGLLGAA